MNNYQEFANDIYKALIDIEYYAEGVKYPVGDEIYYDFQFHNFDNYKHNGQEAEKHPLLKEYKEELVNSLQNHTLIPRIYLDCNDSSFLQGDVRVIESFMKYIKEPAERSEIYSKIFDLMDVSIVLSSLSNLNKEDQQNLFDLVLNHHKNEKPRLNFLYHLIGTNFYNTIFKEEEFLNSYRERILELLEHNYPLIEKEDKEKHSYVYSSSIRESLEKWVKKNEQPSNWFMYEKFFPKSLYKDEKKDLFEDNVYSIIQMRVNYSPIIKLNDFITNYNTVKIFINSIIYVINSHVSNISGLNNIMLLNESQDFKDIGLILNSDIEKEKIVKNIKKIIEESFNYYNNCIYQGINIETEELAKSVLKKDFIAVMLEVNTPQKEQVKAKRKI